MRYFIFGLFVMLTLGACKARNSVNQTEVKEAEAFEHVEGNHWKVTCARGFFHNGRPYAQVEQHEVLQEFEARQRGQFKLCTERDPNYGGGGNGGGGNGGGGNGGGGNGGGGNGGGQDENLLAKCNRTFPPIADSRLQELTFLFDEGIVPNLSNPLNLRTFCLGFVKNLHELVSGNSTLEGYLFQNGGTLISVKPADTAVLYNSEIQHLIIPVVMNSDVKQAVIRAYAQAGYLACEKQAFNSCWYIAQPGQTCKQFCEGIQLPYDANSANLLAENGGEANCRAVATLWGYSVTKNTSISNWEGCGLDGSDGGWWDPGNDFEANSAYRYFCSCRVDQ